MFWRRLRQALNDTRGAVDLASVMVGILVIGVASAVVLAAVFGVIPWTQDNAAQRNLDAVRTAESIAKVADNGYGSYATLVSNKRLAPSATVTADTDPLQTCWLGLSMSSTGTPFWSSAANPSPQAYVSGTSESDPAWCATSTPIAQLLASIGGGVVITVGTPPKASKGQPYSYQITYQGTASPTFTIGSGSLLPGLSLTPAGLITGTPTSTGTATFTVVATASPGGKSTASVTIISANPPTLPATTTLPIATNGVAYSATVTASGGDAPITYAVTSGALPAGLTMSTGGVISGTPTSTGITSFTVTATNSSGTGSTAATLAVAKPFAVIPPLVAAGSVTSYTIDAAGNGVSWGATTRGELGNGSLNTGQNASPQKVSGTFKYASIAAGDSFAIALDSSGHLYGWGDNTYGQLGLGGSAPTAETAPVTISAPTIYSMVASGSDHTVALDNLGRLWAWGGNASSQTGIAPAGTNVLVPTLIPSTKDQMFNWVAAGPKISAAIDSDGHLWTWGSNANGALGNGATSGTTATPTEIAPTQTFSTVAAGGANGSMLAVDTAGHLWGWGTNDQGQLGLNTKTNVSTPTAASSAATFVSVTVGQTVSYAIDSTRNGYSMGGSTVGALGQSATTSALVPTKLTWPAGVVGTVTGIASHGQTAILATNSGARYAWGQNDKNQVGDGTNALKTAPVLLTVP